MRTGVDVYGRAIDARWNGGFVRSQATSRNRRIASRIISLVVVCSAPARASIAARNPGSEADRHDVG